MMLPTLRFLIDHLLRRGARGEGRTGLEGFTFDHVLDGAVMGGFALEAGSRLVEVEGNVATEQLLPPACDQVSGEASTRWTQPDAARTASGERDPVPPAAGVRGQLAVDRVDTVAFTADSNAASSRSPALRSAGSATKDSTAQNKSSTAFA